MKENNENKAKALEENKKNYSSENSTPQNGEDILSSTYKCNFLGADNKQ